MPGFRGETIDSFSFPSMGPDGSTTFVAYLPGDEGSGLFSSSGTLQALATTRTRAPTMFGGNGDHKLFTGFRAGSGGVPYSVFVASQSAEDVGLFVAGSGPISLVAGSGDTPLPAPYHRANFTGFDGPHFDGQSTVFESTSNAAAGAPKKALVLLRGGKLSIAASSLDKIPGLEPPQLFTNLEDPQLVTPQDGYSTAVVFFGSNSGIGSCRNRATRFFFNPNSNPNPKHHPKHSPNTPGRDTASRTP